MENIESLKQTLEGFDPSVLLPDLSTLPGKVELALRIACLIGPLILLGLGLLYFLAPAKEANYTFGYRTHRGMASVESWRFTQKLAGITWSVLGLVLAVVMAVLCSGFHGMEMEAMILKALRYVLWEIGLLVACAIGIWVTVMVVFDRNGCRRDWNRKE